MRVLIFILICFFYEVSFSAKQNVCSIDNLIDDSQFDSISVHSLAYKVKYLRIDTLDGRPCASYLTPSYFSDGTMSENAINHDGVFEGFSRRIFKIKTRGQNFCLKNGSVWEVISSRATMKTAELTLKSLDSNLNEMLFFSTYYESSVASAKEFSGIRPLKCAP